MIELNSPKRNFTHPVQIALSKPQRKRTCIVVVLHGPKLTKTEYFFTQFTKPASMNPENRFLPTEDPTPRRNLQLATSRLHPCLPTAEAKSLVIVIRWAAAPFAYQMKCPPKALERAHQSEIPL
jgi:hypothetical protein